MIAELCTKLALMPLFAPDVEEKLEQGWSWGNIFHTPEESVREYNMLQATKDQREAQYAADRATADAIRMARIADADAAVDDPEYWAKKKEASATVKATDYWGAKKVAAAVTTTAAADVPYTHIVQRDMPLFPSERRTLMAKNLPRDICVTELRTIFAKYGPIVDLYIPKNADRSSPYFGTIKGFAKIQFLSADSAAAAYKGTWLGLNIRGNNISVEPANADSAPSRTY